ncbi:hypothetical protein NIES4073_67990 [Kalymmatonema gypsitolerans NIES-4073]|nr:hypothetical protein NIES4073_67990 [Scytonema sp. NIES-4073]
MSDKQFNVSTVSNDQPTEEQMAYAYVFLNELKANKQLEQDWQDHLQKASVPQYGIQDKISYLDNFLADSGYDTTAEAVLTLLKTPWWNDYIKSRQPNLQSDRFVQDLLQDTHLYKEWSQIIQECTQSGNLEKANQFLQNNGYDCTAIQVNASFQKMRSQNLNYWTGIYGQTTLKQGDGEAQVGPAVIVYGNSTVSVGPDKLFAFKYEQGVLTWTTEGRGGLEKNPHSGSITFSQISQPKRQDSFVGNIFSGTITYPPGSKNWSGTYNFNGKIGDPADDEKGKVYTPPSVNKSSVQQLADTLAPYVMIGFAIQMMYPVAAKIFSGAKVLWEKVKEKVQSQAKEAVEKTAQERPEVPAERFSESTTVEQLRDSLQRTADPARQEEIREEIQQTEQAQEKQYEEEERSVTEEGKNTEVLDDLMKLKV